MGSTAPPRRRSGADMEKKQVLSGKSQQVKYSNSEADTHGGDALSAWRRLHRSYVDGTPGRLDAGEPARQRRRPRWTDTKDGKSSSKYVLRHRGQRRNSCSMLARRDWLRLVAPGPIVLSGLFLGQAPHLPTLLGSIHPACDPITKFPCFSPICFPLWANRLPDSSAGGASFSGAETALLPICVGHNARDEGKATGQQPAGRKRGRLPAGGRQEGLERASGGQATATSREIISSGNATATANATPLQSRPLAPRPPASICSSLAFGGCQALLLTLVRHENADSFRRRSGWRLHVSVSFFVSSCSVAEAGKLRVPACSVSRGGAVQADASSRRDAFFFFLSPPIDPAAAATGQPSVGAWVDCQMGCRRNRRMRSAPLLPNGFCLCCGLRRRLHRSRRCARSSGERGRDGKKHGSGRTQGQAIAVSRQRAPPRSPARRSLYLVSAAPHRLSRLIALRFTPMRKASAGLEPALADTRTRSLSAACFIYFDRCTRSNSCSHGLCGRLQRLQQASAGFKRLLKTQIAGDYASQHGRCGVPLV